MSRYYLLASTKWLKPEKRGFPYPYQIGLCFEPVKSPAMTEEGWGHYYSGGVTNLSALAEVDGFITACDAEWLVPFVQRMLAGEEVKEAVLAAFREKHGRDAGYLDLGND